MEFPSWRNRADKEGRKTMKYTTVRVELRVRHPDFKINQTNIIVDVLGEYSKGLREQLTTLPRETATRGVLVLCKDYVVAFDWS